MKFTLLIFIFNYKNKQTIRYNENKPDLIIAKSGSENLLTTDDSARQSRNQIKHQGTKGTKV
jgi:hypothetical protein